MYASHICLYIKYLNKYYNEYCVPKIGIRNMFVIKHNVVECLISKPDPAGKKYLVIADGDKTCFV